MEAKNSPLRLLDFTIFSSKIESYLPENPEDINLNALPINIDFERLSSDDPEDNSKMIKIQIKINPSKKKYGYVMSFEAGGIFDIAPSSNINKEIKNNLLGISAVSIMISQLRVYIQNITSYSTCGTYLLPPIDINDLIEKKVKSEKKH
ncbi:MAG: hypothetical protein U9Q98_08415 [Bacteroidota bacterium]|nr:hypothetical protein [Bacteroidota bacterium]